ncbi:hypothetical protein M433DRAFT_293227 [Acidomyces richmondensis BFW]|nr:hypothetical protein M433DRAFT_293227 [Acidomyces richmondensis BFW]
MASEFTSGGITAIAVCVFIDTVAIVSTFLRYLNRYQGGESLRRDDIFMAAALVFSFSMTINLGMEIHWVFRLAHDSPAMAAKDFETFLLINYIVENFYTLSMAASKLSIAFFYLRVFGSMRWMRIGCNIVIGMVGTWTIACILIGIFQCRPVSKAWNITLPGYCIDLSIFFVVQRSTNLVSDIMLLSLPVKAVMGLQASLAKRVSLVIAFLLGGIVCFASAYCVALTAGIIGKEIKLSDYRTLLWSVIELELGVTCGNLPFGECDQFPVLKEASPN